MFQSYHRCQWLLQHFNSHRLFKALITICFIYDVIIIVRNVELRWLLLPSILFFFKIDFITLNTFLCFRFVVECLNISKWGLSFIAQFIEGKTCIQILFTQTNKGSLLNLWYCLKTHFDSSKNNVFYILTSNRKII